MRSCCTVVFINGLAATNAQRVQAALDRIFHTLARLRRAGGQDVLADPADVRLLTAALAPGVVVLAHEEPGYEHFDFTWGEDAHARIYPIILDLLRLYS